VGEYPDRQSAGPDALLAIQRRRGWISDEILADIAAHLDLSPAALDAIATFYNRIYRRAVGKHIVLICDSVSCWITGYENLRDHLFRRLGIHDFGQTSSDGLCTVLAGPCLGACDHAPVMMIDNELHGDLTADKIDRCIDALMGPSRQSTNG